MSFIHRFIFILLAVSLQFPPCLWGGDDQYAAERLAMVRDQIRGGGIADPRVLQAMSEVPRHLFVPGEYRSRAYYPRPLPIGEGQTISQPYIVGFMTEILRLKPTDRVLEVGTGSGYQAAVAAKIAAEVYSVEIFESLASRSRAALAAPGYGNVHVRQGDGYYGWEEKSPFDAIIVTCAGGHIPPPLLRQLKNGGRMVMPVGGPFLTQNLVFIEKGSDGNISQRNVLPVAFVRLLGH
ncbi:MAG: protein-L-isoaspartate(D-aspartate) O-methyltransferase [Deltaproteobacteria bacterium]|nr:protein-L-isoaspartate(D-aspartate) O-methyltransferase [Deltaproteobacteria bacterium]